LWQELRDHGASLNRALNEALRIHSGSAWRVFQVSWISSSFAVPPPALFRVRAFPDARASRLARCWQELERRTRERYDALDRLNADLHWYRGQYEALDALVEALRSPDWWLAYRVEALLDMPPEQGAQAAGGASTVERVRTALVERDDALRRAREDLAGARSIATAWEAEVATAHAQLQQDRTALEGGRAWQSQAKEKVKEAEGLRATLASKAETLAAADEQLRQEGAARQQAETRLQQEQAALTEARAALEQERLAREEALGKLQQERAALEGTQATLKQWEDEVSRLNGDLVQISISHEDLRRSLEEQEAMVLNLQRQAKEARQSLEGEKKLVEGEFTFIRFFACRFVLLGIRSQLCFTSFVAFRPADCPGEHDHPGRGSADGLQLLSTGVGRAAGRRP
jgi:chromosome segregation ATPase